jgi:hypothetical protein
MKIAKDFITDHNIPIWTMWADSSITTTGSTNSYLLSDDTSYYVAVVPSGITETTIDLDESNSTFSVKWFNPRTGGTLQDGTITEVSSGNDVSIGTAPDNSNSWVALITRNLELVTAIAILPEECQVPIGETTQLYPSVTPTNASIKTLTWTSSNTAIASVDADGLITAVSEGSVTITATATDGSNVSSPVTVTVPNISISSANVQFEQTGNNLTIQAEDIYNLNSWSIKQEGTIGYIEWGINNNFSTPGTGLISMKIKINDPGIYEFKWRTKIGEGTSETDENDSWIRFPDADDNFGIKENEEDLIRIYPLGSGKTPNPEGSGSDNWWKVYMNRLGWRIQTRTSDNDPHTIYVQFDTSGVYTMQISARSQHHLIDRFNLVRQTTLGINDSNGDLNFKIYPNPTTSSNEVSISGLTNDLYTVTIMDVFGKTVSKKEIQFKNNVEKLNLDYLHTGVYFITLNTINSSKTAKLIIK